MRTQPQRARRAFVLVEAVIAILILALIAVGAAPFFYFGRTFLYRASLRRQAVELATDRIESLMNDSYELVQDDERTVHLGNLEGQMITEVEPGAVGPSGRGYKRVSVTVRWVLGQRQDSVTLVTYVGNVWG